MAIWVMGVLAILAFLQFMSPAQADTPPEIQKEIDRSIAAFPGECPCPCSKDKNGQFCGEHSAYLLSEHKYGYIPFCYPSDIQLFPPNNFKPDKANKNKQSRLGEQTI